MRLLFLCCLLGLSQAIALPTIDFTYHNDSTCTSPCTTGYQSNTICEWGNHYNIPMDGTCQFDSFPNNSNWNEGLRARCNYGVTQIIQYNTPDCDDTVPVFQVSHAPGACIQRRTNTWYNMTGCDHTTQLNVEGPVNILFFKDLECSTLESDLLHQSQYESLVGIPQPDMNPVCRNFSNLYFYQLYFVHTNATNYDVHLTYFGRSNCTSRNPSSFIYPVAEFEIPLAFDASSYCVKTYNKTGDRPSIRLDGVILPSSAGNGNNGGGTASSSSSSSSSSGASSSSSSTFDQVTGSNSASRMFSTTPVIAVLGWLCAVATFAM